MCSPGGEGKRTQTTNLWGDGVGSQGVAGTPSFPSNLLPLAMPDKCSQGPSLSNSFVTLSHMPAKGWACPGDHEEEEISRRGSPKVTPGPLGWSPSPLQLLTCLQNQPCCSFSVPHPRHPPSLLRASSCGDKGLGDKRGHSGLEQDDLWRVWGRTEDCFCGPIKGITKPFLVGPHGGRCLERRHPFGNKKSDITCGISFEGGEE